MPPPPPPPPQEQVNAATWAQEQGEDQALAGANELIAHPYEDCDDSSPGTMIQRSAAAARSRSEAVGAAPQQLQHQQQQQQHQQQVPGSLLPFGGFGASATALAATGHAGGGGGGLGPSCWHYQQGGLCAPTSAATRNSGGAGVPAGGLAGTFGCIRPAYHFAFAGQLGIGFATEDDADEDYDDDDNDSGGLGGEVTRGDQSYENSLLSVTESFASIELQSSGQVTMTSTPTRSR